MVARGDLSALNQPDKYGQTPLHLACYKVSIGVGGSCGFVMTWYGVTWRGTVSPGRFIGYPQ